MEFIKKCRVCSKGGKVKVVADLGKRPLAGQFFDTKAEAVSARTYPLTLVSCIECGTVQVGEDIDDKVLYSKYNYRSSEVPGLVRHFDDLAREVIDLFRERPMRSWPPLSLLEIGCNDGVFLKKFSDEFMVLVGVDPSDVAKNECETINGRLTCVRDGKDVYYLSNRPISFDNRKKILDDVGVDLSFDVITASNCFAHFTGIGDAIKAVDFLLADSGRLVIEVHDFSLAVKGSPQWDTFYHEHKIEWSLSSLKRAMAGYGFVCTRHSSIDTHGGLVRCFFEKTDGRDFEISIGNDSTLAEKIHVAFEKRRESTIYNRLVELSDEGKLCAYGASGRANMFFHSFPELKFQFVVDDSSARLGKFTPVTGIEIVSKDRLLGFDGACLVTAWNWFDEIVEANGGPGSREWLRYFS